MGEHYVTPSVIREQRAARWLLGLSLLYAAALGPLVVAVIVEVLG